MPWCWWLWWECPLSVVYQALRPQQIENIENDTKRQILAAALITPAPGENVADLYGSHITDSFIVNAKRRPRRKRRKGV